MYDFKVHTADGAVDDLTYRFVFGGHQGSADRTKPSDACAAARGRAGTPEAPCRR